MKFSEYALIGLLCFALTCFMVGIGILAIVSDPECRRELIRIGVIKPQRRLNELEQWQRDFPPGHPDRWDADNIPHR